MMRCAKCGSDDVSGTMREATEVAVATAISTGMARDDFMRGATFIWFSQLSRVQHKGAAIAAGLDLLGDPGPEEPIPTS